MPLLFALTLFVGAALLFSVQPMIAKMVLPLLGGAPAVWNTCMVFFQAALLAGYAYAHATATRLGIRRQVILHVGLLLVPLALLPFGVAADAARSLAPQADPSLWLLGLLGTTVGLPFFVVAATAPLLQRWFSRTGHPTAHDPYFLYAASNAGSLLALLAYPLALEPNLRLSQQSALWAAGYGALVLLTAGCAATVWRAPDPAPETAATEEVGAGKVRPGWGRWLRWVALAFLPSSLMLGVTTYLTTDIVAIPLLWVIPLALYLLTFILAFARRPPLPHAWMLRAMPMAIVLLTLVMCIGAPTPAWIPVHLVAFFVVALVCHGELARDRPPPQDLTGFYLALSVGGVLGGLFNALVAPIAFDRIVEYPLVLALAGLVRPPAPGAARTPRAFLVDVLLPLALGVGAYGLVVATGTTPRSFLGGGSWLAVFAVAVFICFTFLDRPVRFALGIAAVLVARGLVPTGDVRVVHRERSFFGTLQVAVDRGRFHRLTHGSTVHGQQNLHPERRRTPLSYYHPTGPIGQVFEVYRQRPALRSVAAVGLGTGSLASYAQPDQRWTFFEIDPSVARIAGDRRYFTYLADSRAEALEVVLGDARLKLGDAPDRGYGLIVLDAFTSDAIPLHLLTREAMGLYRAKLADGGLIAVHTSNRFLDLAPVLGNLARDAGWICRIRSDPTLSPAETLAGKHASSWAVLAARAEDLGPLAEDPRWSAPPVPPGTAVWTDDYSDVVGLFKGRKTTPLDPRRSAAPDR